ncbi:MAG TPA: hypothetical protein VK923_09045 [Euzebyales bacterium]|nr:hypothetical protein [Euzebyales bacterium]
MVAAVSDAWWQYAEVEGGRSRGETMAEAAAVLRKLDIEPVANPVEAL